MRSATLSNVALAATLTTLVSAQGSYVLKDDLSYNNFFENFDFYSGADPTNGFVQYQTKENATQNQLVGFFEDQQSIFLGVDAKNKAPNGRASVRVESTKSWNKGLLIADIRHMPASTCGTWPAYWLLGQQNVGTDDWPKGGEIDLLEGVNLDSAAAVTLHTSAGCEVDNATSSLQGRAESAFLGSMSTANCDVAATDQDKNVGCSIKAPKFTAQNGLATYGTDFNTAGGGVYAMEWTDISIAVWFLPRNSTALAAATSSTVESLDPSTFGTPLAKFQGSGCDFEERFKNMRIIFDTTFCGDWAGKEWEESTCAATTGAATCEEYVQNNPEAFAQSYWEIAGLKWFEKQDGASVPVASSVPAASQSIGASVPVASSIPASSANPGTPPSSVVTPNPASSVVLPSVSLSVPTTAVNIASSSVAAAPASSSVAAAPAAGNGTGTGSGGGSSPNMAGFIWPTAHVGGGGQAVASSGASSISVASSTAGTAPSSVASSGPGASSPAVSVPVASNPAASTPVASLPVASTPAAADPAASTPVASAPAATEPAASLPVASTPAAANPAASTAVASTPAAADPAASTPVASTPAAANPAASTAVASTPAGSLPAASSPAAVDPAASFPVASTPAAADPAASTPAAANPAASTPAAPVDPAASSTLLNAPTQAGNQAGSTSAAAAPVDAVPSTIATVASPTATPPAATSSAAATPSVGASSSSAAFAPSSTSTSTPSTGSGTGGSSGGSSPHMKGFIWPTNHVGKRGLSMRHARGIRS